MRQKIILNLELADHAMKLGHFALMVDLFLFALAKEVRNIRLLEIFQSSVFGFCDF